ncbi:uncharacterized protein Z520_07705 [Fonsecaea multimorphosa CBS 102226]|uniref:C2H2-type domain-containing protein n=1 Tax=Fonsecaea multimorphosa CBS 102226 TaxID=1442371 RepID=A0A0D2K0J6_9EURO|nr:uncharacterized protein Z520_07705 [Fonsecaea multimorphosa CBS 102226]KIX96439.1 hypothetical protein Z520_07705 [Fonsecaea multimorphosa CBS 102226]OAL22349.1 hypothetical protein AYO22_07393 [Fonsecaea multimorphosa]
MGRTSPQGLRAQDFHHQPYVNPVDVFPPKSRLATRAQNYRSPIRGQVPSRSPSRFATETHKFACCGEEEDSSFRPSSALNCCVDYDHGSTAVVDFGEAADDFTGCCDEPHHSSPSPMDCEDCVDDCDDCVEEHLKANHRTSNYVDDCEECNEEKDIKCLNGAACQGTCDECDFSCFDCIDWSQFERDKALGLSFSVPLLDESALTAPSLQFDETNPAGFRGFDIPNAQADMIAPPLDVPMHHQCFDNAVPYWNSIAQEQICPGNPGLNQQLPLPPFRLEFGCHPAAAHQRASLSGFLGPDPMNLTSTSNLHPQAQLLPTAPPPKDPLKTTAQDLLSAVTAPETSRACQWLMPCGTVCGASFATGTDLKKHLKTVHLVKGVTKCQWQDCDSPDFGSEAALTGHISKKHLASFLTTAVSSSSGNPGGHRHQHLHKSEGPFKCTFPSCPKSFMYKQVRDEHVATHHNGNKMYCHICHTFLNGEGSNFKRHMATHRPKHQHTLCKYHGLGCKRRFPRLDNLRRHEACCKFGKGLKGAKDSKSAVETQQQHHHHSHHHHSRS